MLDNQNDFKESLLTGKIVKGRVVVNNDPLKLGRVKVRVSEIFPNDVDSEVLPWVMPMSFNSSVNGQCNINVPDIGTECFVMYPSDDVYSGIYLTATANLSEEFLDNYPYCYGFIDRSGSLFIVNTQTDNYTFYHISGTRINIDGYGRTKIQVTDNNEANANATSDNQRGLTIEVVGDINLKCSGDYNIDCSNFNLNASGDCKIKTNAYNLSSNTTIDENASGDINILSSATTNLSSSATTNINSDGNISLVGSGLSMLSSSGSGSMTVSAGSGYIGNPSGKGISFGSGRTCLDNHPLKDFQTDVSHTPFIAFDPNTTISPPTPPTPPTLPSVNVESPTKIDINPESPRKRQAYQDNQ